MGSRGRHGVTGGVATLDGVGHTVGVRLQRWEEEDRDWDHVGAECGSSREGGCGRKGERMSSRSPRPEHRGGSSGHGMSKPLTPSTPLPRTPASEGSPSRTFRGGRPATPWGGNRGQQGLQRFSSHPHLPGLLGN